MTNHPDIQTYLTKMEELRRRIVMKENVIEAAGRTWSYLKQNGETNLTVLPRRLKERSEIVNQALGWLAREDKLQYAQKAGKTFVSLSE